MKLKFKIRKEEGRQQQQLQQKTRAIKKFQLISLCTNEMQTTAATAVNCDSAHRLVLMIWSHTRVCVCAWARQIRRHNLLLLYDVIRGKLQANNFTNFTVDRIWNEGEWNLKALPCYLLDMVHRRRIDSNSSQCYIIAIKYSVVCCLTFEFSFYWPIVLATTRNWFGKILRITEYTRKKHSGKLFIFILRKKRNKSNRIWTIKTGRTFTEPAICWGCIFCQALLLVPPPLFFGKQFIRKRA